MYTQSAAYYDIIYRGLKNYREEAEKIDALLQRLQPTPQGLLDVACGTGEHARHLRQSYGYAVDGLDINPEFVAIARQKTPDAHFEVADMRSFALPRRYDALLCLFSSIGYVETETGLGQAFDCFARHLNPGGWLVCEPWLTPKLWNAKQTDSVSAIDPRNGERITRNRSGSTDGTVSVLTIEYEVEAKDGHSRFEEIHRLGLFSKKQTEAALCSAGFEARWLPAGLQAHCLFVAQKRLG